MAISSGQISCMLVLLLTVLKAVTVFHDSMPATLSSFFKSEVLAAMGLYFKHINVRFFFFFKVWFKWVCFNVLMFLVH